MFYLNGPSLLLSIRNFSEPESPRGNSGYLRESIWPGVLDTAKFVTSTWCVSDRGHLPQGNQSNLPPALTIQTVGMTLFWEQNTKG